MRTYQQDDQIMKLLDLKEIRRVICNSDKGYLNLVIRKGEKEYHLTLDAVPLPKELNKEIMDLLFPKEITSQDKHIEESIILPKKKELLKVIKKLGRPKGVKNGIRKEEEIIKK